MPEFTFTPSSFGGGWLESHNYPATRWGADWFGEPPGHLPPIDASGWLVEPHQLHDLIDAIEDAQLTVVEA